MKVLFDAHWLVSGPPSGRNVVQGLIVGWSRAFPHDDITLRLPRSEWPEASDWMRRNAVVARLVSALKWNHGLSVMATVNGHGSDLYITQNFTPPFVRNRAAVYIHDAIFIDHPEWFTRLERRYLSLIGFSSRFARVVLASSQSESRRLNRVWPWLRLRTAVVGYGMAAGLRAAPPTQPMDFPLQRPYVLCVGRLNVRKNLARLLEAFLSDPALSSHYDLVVVGSRNGLEGEGISSLEGESVRFLGQVSDGELAWLYSHSRLFVFPSLDEGYGLPLVEAAYFGVNSVASDIPPFREMDLAVSHFDPRTPSSIADALRAGLSHDLPGQRADLPDWPGVVALIRRTVAKH